jgi:large subunit ribosomal protein L15
MRRARKITKMRGNRFCGKGANDRHRGKGNKGGSGNAGSKGHKRMQFMKIYGASYFGRRRGFKNKKPSLSRSINISELETLCAEKNLKEVNLEALGYTKLLGAGTLTTSLTITAPRASNKAVEKVKAAGGSVTLTEGAPLLSTPPNAEKPPVKGGESK